jgi:hypothetical protein
MDLHREQWQEVMEISSEEEEKSHQMRLGRRQKQESTDSSDSVSDNESRPTQ